MKNYKSYKFRIYPNKQQENQINKTYNYTRYIYNYYLEYQKQKGPQTIHQLCTNLKYLQQINPQLKQIDQHAITYTINSLIKSYKKYQNKQSLKPKYKNKNEKQTYTTYNIKNQNTIELDLINKRIKLPTLGLVKLKGYKKIAPGKIINATITKELTNKYYVSILTQTNIQYQKKVIPTTIVGIDLGIRKLITTSDGNYYSNQKSIKKYENKIKELQQKLSNQQPDSQNYNKTKQKIALLYSRIKNTRKHNAYNIVNDIVKNYDIIVSEKLKVKQMTHNNTISKYIMDARFSTICTLLKNKSQQYGKYYYQINTYYPSSQICSRCGNRNEKIKNLNNKIYICNKCGLEIDRDINASINIMFEGLKQHYKTKK